MRYEFALKNYDVNETNFISAGPSLYYKNYDDMLRDFASLWRRSSLQLHRLSSSNGIRYYNFLQPNLYVPGSIKQRFRKGTQKYTALGYHYIIKNEAPKLIKDGVNYHDLTMIFADINEPVYRDTCCHVNYKGQEILGAAIGTVIRQDFDNRSPIKKD